MQITVGEQGEIILGQVYNSIVLELGEGNSYVDDQNQTFAICMRDGGFEFKYGGNWYSAQEGVIVEKVITLQIRKDNP